MNWIRLLLQRQRGYRDQNTGQGDRPSGLETSNVRSVGLSSFTDSPRPEKGIQRLPKHWTEHPVFSGARDVVVMRELIEKTIAAAPNSTRDEGAALDLAIGTLPAWPQYEESRIQLADEGAPIWWSPGFEFPENDDGIALFQIATLRERANAYGVKGKSKAELATRLRALLSHEAASQLAKEGRASWQASVDKRERRRFCEVLGHTVAAASISISNARSIEAAFPGKTHRLRWLSGPCCSKCDLANDSVREVGYTFPHVKVTLIPAHPGCSCACINEEVS